jgi:hypothetical protein
MPKLMKALVKLCQSCKDKSNGFPAKYEYPKIHTETLTVLIQKKKLLNINPLYISGHNYK